MSIQVTSFFLRKQVYGKFLTFHLLPGWHDGMNVAAVVRRIITTSNAVRSGFLTNLAHQILIHRSMEHSHIIQLHHPSGMLYEAFGQFTKEHADASFFQSDTFFRMIRQQEHTEAILLLALARTPAPAAGKDAEQSGDAGHPEEESLFPGGVLLFRGHKPPDPDPNPQAANPQPPTPNSQPPTTNSQQPTPNPEEGGIPGVGRIVGSLLAVTFCAKTGWGRRMRRRTVVFGGPLLASGSRLDQETRLRNLLNAMDRHVKGRSLSVHIFSFRSWNKLFPVFRELGFMDGGNLNAQSAWKAVLGNNAETLTSQGSSVVDHASLEKQLETCVARHGPLYKVNRQVLQFFLKLFSSRL